MEKTPSAIWKETSEKVRFVIRNEELETLIIDPLRILKREKMKCKRIFSSDKIPKKF